MQRVETPLVLAAWKQGLAVHPDPEFREYLLVEGDPAWVQNWLQVWSLLV